MDSILKSTRSEGVFLNSIYKTPRLKSRIPEDILPSILFSGAPGVRKRCGTSPKLVDRPIYPTEIQSLRPLWEAAMLGGQ
jgi:hypothetical protein